MVEITGNDRLGKNGPRFLKNFRLAIAPRDVGQHQAVDSRIPGQLRCPRRRKVSETTRHIRLAPQIRGLDDQHIGPAHSRLQVLGPSGVADVDQTRARPWWTQHVFGMDHATIGQRHRFTSDQASPLRPLGDTQCLRLFIKERATRFLAK